MPIQKHSLRDLAHKLEETARSHPAWSSTPAREAITVLLDHLAILARVMDINQDESRPFQKLSFKYENYRGEISSRIVNPLSIRWGTSEWYTEPQWLLMCFDIGKRDRREFAINRMSSVNQVDRI